MTRRDFNKLGNVQAAIDILRMYNSFVLFPAMDDTLQNPALEAYFSSPLDDPIERKVEKIICASAIRAVYDNSNIPEINKEHAAKVTARELRAALQMAKLEYKASSEGLSVSEYNKRKRSNIIVRKVAMTKKAKSLLKNLSITALVTAVAGPVGANLAMGVRIVWPLLPDNVRIGIKNSLNRAKEVAYNTLNNTLKAVKKTYEVFKSTEVGKKVENAINAVKPYVTKVIDKADKVVTKIKDCAKSFWARLFT